ncbi:VWA domain-containing protein [Leptospira sp. 96542]|nr:VWA domain-containing protein [Leptospira sp. 96542]
MINFYKALLLATIFIIVNGCSSSRSASYFSSNKKIEHGILDFHNSLKIDEYINAFKQENIIVPKSEDVVFSSDFFQKSISSIHNKSLLQIAIKTRKENDKEKEELLGISLVLDISGSMFTDNKNEDSIESIKNAILEFREGTEFSLVLFNSSSELYIPPIVISNKNRKDIIEKVKNIEFGGGTNIEDGLVLGYKAMSEFKNENSRLILITDGISNVGITNPEEIAKKAKVEFIKGGRISTIGLGYDVDENLLRKIAKKGNGFYYFSDNAKTLTKYLREDLTSFIKPCLYDVVLNIEENKGYKVLDVYGYTEYKNKDNQYNIDIGELNVDDWRIFIVEIEKIKKITTEKEIPVVAKLTYKLKPKDKLNELVVKSSVNWNSKSKNNINNINEKVARNAVIFSNAIALQEISKLYNEGKYSEAKGISETQRKNIEIYTSISNDNELIPEITKFNSIENILNKDTKNPEKPNSERPVEKKNLNKFIKDAMVSYSLIQPGPWSIILILFAENIM